MEINCAPRSCDFIVLHSMMFKVIEKIFKLLKHLSIFFSNCNVVPGTNIIK